MKNCFYFLVISILLFLQKIPAFAQNIGAVFKISPIAVIDHGKLNKTNGTYKQIYKLKNNQICRISSENLDNTELTDNDGVCFQTSLIHTLDNKDYYMARSEWNVIIIDTNFNEITLYQWGRISDYCTVWYGKSIKNLKI